MNGERFVNSASYPLRKDEHGRALCRWCGAAVPSGRRSWCSQKCVDEFMLRNNSGSVRAELLKRDKGVCGICGVDTIRLYRLLQLSRFGSPRWNYGPWWSGQHPKHKSAMAMLYRAYPWLIAVRGRNTLWDADHIVPVVRGGGKCGLNNYRTLCIGCHKAETKALAASRAKERRGLRDMFSEQVAA